MTNAKRRYRRRRRLAMQWWEVRRIEAQWAAEGYRHSFTIGHIRCWVRDTDPGIRGVRTVEAPE